MIVTCLVTLFAPHLGCFCLISQFGPGRLRNTAVRHAKLLLQVVLSFLLVKIVFKYLSSILNFPKLLVLS